MRARGFFVFLLLQVALCLHPGARAAQRSSSELADLSLEELSNIEITSVSKRAERLSDAAASVFVITNEDIRRAGATSLPEALRLAPNLQVAQASAYGYTASARGFGNSASNKLLVLIDGRSVYTPLFSGVFWDVQDVMLEDVERIEVISGPGGTLWGANAVNGIINIITRSARSTQGALASAGAGNRGSGAAFRYGGSTGADGNYRVYGKYDDGRHTETADGTAKPDAWHRAQVGFRADWDRLGDQVMLQGNAYNGAEGQPAPGLLATGVKFDLGTISLSGVNLVGRWAHQIEGGSSVSLQAYYDRTERTVPPTIAETLDIFDVQLQHALPPAGIHSVTWGAEYRYAMDRVTNSPYISFLPASVNQSWPSVFAQDEISLSERLQLTLGARLERNDYTGNEFLPSARLAWKLAPSQLLWTALSRTVRAPSRFDRDVFVPFVPGGSTFLLRGGPNVVSETAKVLEVGYRGQLANRFSYSLTVFHTVYDHLRTQEVVLSGPFIVFASEMRGKSTGIETWGTYQASPTWRLSGGLSALRERLELKPGSNDPTAVSGQQGRDPAQAWMLRSSHDLSARSEFDAILRHVSSLANPLVPAYTAVDLRFGWRPRPGLELSVTAKNLTGSGHGEFTDVATRTQLERSVFFKVVSRF
jgi:iron complex outermembrane receptor protein